MSVDEGLIPLDDEAEPERFGGSRRGVGLALAVLVLLTLIAVVGGKSLVGRIRPADYAGPGEGSVTVEIPRGASASRMGSILEDAGVVKSAGAFKRAASAEAKASGIQPGFYELRLRMKASLAVALLLDPRARIRSRFTIPEGTTVTRTLEIIAKSVDRLPLADLKAAAAAPAALGLPPYAKGRLEGFLFPATYDVEPGTSAVEVLTMMVDRFDLAAERLQLVDRAAELGRTPYEILTIGSLVEAETPKADQRGKVARVAYNRLAKGMALQFDSTIQYALSAPKKQLFNSDLALDSPYNTYKHKGLPPTPINAPGEAALEAALAPTPGPWLYFVVIDKAGNSGFTADYAEFQRFKEIYKREVLGQ